MKKWIVYSIPLAVLWVFVNGTFNVSSMIQGLAVALPVAYFYRRFYPGDTALDNPRKFVHIVPFFASFFKELFKANADTTYRVLHPDNPTDSKIFNYRTRLENPLAVTLLANSITLTPGTLVVDFSEDTRNLKIHVLSGDIKGTEQTIKNWEETLLKTFGGKR